jgi:hypothetical protein
MMGSAAVEVGFYVNFPSGMAMILVENQIAADRRASTGASKGRMRRP